MERRRSDDGGRWFALARDWATAQDADVEDFKCALSSATGIPKSGMRVSCHGECMRGTMVAVCAWDARGDGHMWYVTRTGDFLKAGFEERLVKSSATSDWLVSRASATVHN